MYKLTKCRLIAVCILFRVKWPSLLAGFDMKRKWAATPSIISDPPCSQIRSLDLFMGDHKAL